MRTRKTPSRPYLRVLSSALLALCALGALMLTPSGEAQAQPPSFRGIDLGTVFTIREQARHLALQQRVEEARERGEAEETFQKFAYIKTIVIDPGHGGENQGAIGVAEVHEKFLTLELAYRLRETLQERYPDANIILTRYWDQELSLSDRIHKANQLDADLFLSLHYNAATHERAIGVETYFLSTEQAIPGKEPRKSKEIASTKPTAAGMEPSEGDREEDAQGVHNDAMLTMQRDLARATQHRNSGLLARMVQDELVDKTRSRNRGVKQANFGVLRGALMPAVVVEAGFVTHPREGKHVTRDKHQGRVVTALVNAIEAFDATMAKQRDE